MEFKLEVKKYQDRVVELESTVEKLQRELKLSREAKSDAGDQASSETETDTVTDATDENQQYEKVNLRCSYNCAACRHMYNFCIRRHLFFFLLSTILQ